MSRLDVPVHRFAACRPSIETDAGTTVTFELLPDAPSIVAPYNFVTKYRGSLGSLASHTQLGARLHRMAAEGGWAADDWLLICEDDLVFTDQKS